MNELSIYEDMDRFDEVFGDLDMTMLHSGEKHLIFVYGTLMAGMRNHHRLERKGVRLISDNAVTAVPAGVMLYSRVTQSKYRAPALAVGKHGGQVLGEVYEISNTVLLDLDRIEGHPYVYHREKMEVTWELDDGHGEDSILVYRYVGEPEHDCTGIKVSCSFYNNETLYRWMGDTK